MFEIGKYKEITLIDSVREVEKAWSNVKPITIFSHLKKKARF